MSVRIVAFFWSMMTFRLCRGSSCRGRIYQYSQHLPTATCSGKEDRVDMANDGDKTFVIMLGRKLTKTM